MESRKENIEKLAQDYLQFVKKYPRVDFPLGDEMSEVEILRASYTIPSPRTLKCPTWEMDRADMPALIQTLGQRVKNKYNANTLRALGYNLCRMMMNIEGRTPALVEGNYGQCMAAIEDNFDMSGMMEVKNLDWLNTGDENSLDQARTAALTHEHAPGLFGPLYMSQEGLIISNSLAALGRVKKEDLRSNYVNQHIYNRIMEVGPDVPAFLSVAMKCLPVGEERAKDIYHVFGLMEDWGLTEDDGVEPELLLAWREAVDASEKMTDIQAQGRKRLGRKALDAVSKQAAKTAEGKPGKDTRLKM